ncbi:MAG: ABC transporter ATP-binding protein [Candidatus Gracilibacteria bacterium]|jgi:ATP-binding cassette subfamily B protein
MRKNTRLTLQFYGKYLRKQWFLVLLVFIGATGGASGAMVNAFFLKNLINALNQGQAERLMPILFSIVGIGLAEWFFWRLSFYSMCIVESRGMKEVADACFEHLHKHSTNFFNNQFVGSLVKRVGRMARSFEDILDQIFYDFYTLSLRIVIAVVVLFTLNFWLGFSILVWVSIFVGLHLWISSYKLKRYNLPKAEADTRLTAQLADSITNNSTIKLFANFKYERSRFAEVTQDWSSKIRAAWFFNNHVEAVQFLFMLSLEFLVFYLAILEWKTGSLTVGHFILLQSYLLELFSQLWGFDRSLRRFYESLADAEEMTEILQTPIEVVDKPRAKNLVMKKGAVDFDRVSFSYTDDIDQSVIKQLSFSVKPGERVALIGLSGGGKTTLIKLLLRLFDLDGGRILLDGQDIAQVTQDSLRKQIALVPQDPVLFHRSLMENIRYGRLEATDKEVITAAKLAHCHEFISKLPKGYQTFVGERGVKLSGGERQRVAIARAILSQTKILVLDEATSSLDSESEKMIKDALKVLMKGKTVFVIAHRLSTVVDMDRILVLEKGQIAEEGTHKDLIKKKSGIYKKLWDLQVGGYLE